MLQTKPVVCKHCQAVNKHHSFQCSKVARPIKRTEIKRNPEPAVRPPVKRTPIKQVSDKRKKELQQYSKLSGPFKKDNPYCHACLEGCTTHTTDIHHMKGRENKMLVNVQYFLPVCRSCHDKIEVNPAMAKERGFSINRTIV